VGLGGRGGVNWGGRSFLVGGTGGEKRKVAVLVTVRGVECRLAAVGRGFAGTWGWCPGVRRLVQKKKCRGGSLRREQPGKVKTSKGSNVGQGGVDFNSGSLPRGGGDKVVKKTRKLYARLDKKSSIIIGSTTWGRTFQISRGRLFVS